MDRSTSNWEFSVQSPTTTHVFRLSIWDKALLDRLLASGRDYFENTLKVRKTETLQFVP